MNYYYVTLDTSTVTFISKRDYLILVMFILIFHCEIFNMMKVSLKFCGNSESRNEYSFVVFD
jgi:hypothetical protein